MSLEARLDVLPGAAPGFEGQSADEGGREAMEGADFTEFPVFFGPARGIFNAVVIGTGAWAIILAAVALARAIFFG
jgi:hypothetical protein